MMRHLKTASYWLTAGSIVALYGLSSRLSGMTFLLILIVCASYCIGRGITEYGKLSEVDWKSPEFTILIMSLVAIYSLGHDLENLFIPIVNMVGCLASYNIGRGLANHYHSKISTVFNR